MFILFDIINHHNPLLIKLFSIKNYYEGNAKKKFLCFLLSGELLRKPFCVLLTFF